jgi:hypothetical protein
MADTVMMVFTSSFLKETEGDDVDGNSTPHETISRWMKVWAILRNADKYGQYRKRYTGRHLGHCSTSGGRCAGNVVAALRVWQCRKYSAELQLLD